MSRSDINRSGEMAVFVQVVELGGFSPAAKAQGLTPSAVSKLVSRLEARLGTRLIHRSTRRLQLTPEGEAFHGRCIAILADIEEAEREAAAGGTPRGRGRVYTIIPIGRHHLLPLVPEFLEAFPDVTLDISLSDQVVDLMQERADVAIRTGPMRASSLTARKLGASRVVVVGAPAYLERRGRPITPADLVRHHRIGFNFTRAEKGWPFLDRASGGERLIPAEGKLQLSDGESVRELALAGIGLARLAQFHVRPDIEAGRLVALLEDFNTGTLQETHAVFLGQGGPLPPRVRAFIDFIAARLDLS